MIPPTAPLNVNNGEKEIFTRLKSTAGTDDWIVLHSLDISEHVRQVTGEADFVVLTPDGIVVLEVKGARAIHRHDGLWYFGDITPGKGEARGPFKQAHDAMQSIRKRLEQRMPTHRLPLCSYAVVFPFVDFTAASGEWTSSQVLDRSKLARQPLPALLRAVIDDTKRRLSVAAPHVSLDRAGLQHIAQALRPDFELHESPRSRRSAEVADLKKYTGEQLAALDAMENNPRVIFNGLAGTGKTVLAVESARRSLGTSASVLCLCYNRLLGDWLARETAAVGAATSGSEIVATTLHAYMLRVAQRHPENSSKFWESDLPQAALERLTSPDAPARFDILILDEAQDLLTDEYLDVLDASLIGGLSGGRWRMFGDFEFQNIFLEGSNYRSAIGERCGIVPEYLLSKNCRNTPRIAELVGIVSGRAPAYAAILREDNGIDPQILYYDEHGKDVTHLAGVLKQLSREGFADEQIVILSLKANGSCAERLHQGGAQTFPLGSENGTRHGTIHAYKGLEAPVIILTDVEDLAPGTMRDLLYVGISRALHKVVIIAHHSVRTSLRQLLV